LFIAKFLSLWSKHSREKYEVRKLREKKTATRQRGLTVRWMYCGGAKDIVAVLGSEVRFPIKPSLFFVTFFLIGLPSFPHIFIFNASTKQQGKDGWA
jgi:hypothetical protein